MGSAYTTEVPTYFGRSNLYYKGELLKDRNLWWLPRSKDYSPDLSTLTVTLNILDKITMWSYAIDVRDSKDPVKELPERGFNEKEDYVLFLYTDEEGFRHITSSKEVPTSLLPQTDSNFGFGTYCARKAPNQWRSKKELILNNFLPSKEDRKHLDFEEWPSDDVLCFNKEQLTDGDLKLLLDTELAKAVLKKWEPARKCDFCIPILCDDHSAQDVMLKDTLSIYMDNGKTRLAGHNKFGEKEPKWRDVWTVRFEHLQSDPGKEQMEKSRRNAPAGLILTVLQQRLAKDPTNQELRRQWDEASQKVNKGPSYVKDQEPDEVVKEFSCGIRMMAAQSFFDEISPTVELLESWSDLKGSSSLEEVLSPGHAVLSHMLRLGPEDGKFSATVKVEVPICVGAEALWRSTAGKWERLEGVSFNDGYATVPLRDHFCDLVATGEQAQVQVDGYLHPSSKHAYLFLMHVGCRSCQKQLQPHLLATLRQFQQCTPPLLLGACENEESLEMKVAGTEQSLQMKLRFQKMPLPSQRLTVQDQQYFEVQFEDRCHRFEATELVQEISPSQPPGSEPPGSASKPCAVPWQEAFPFRKDEEMAEEALFLVSCTTSLDKGTLRRINKMREEKGEPLLKDEVNSQQLLRDLEDKGFEEICLNVADNGDPLHGRLKKNVPLKTYCARPVICDFDLRLKRGMGEDWLTCYKHCSTKTKCGVLIMAGTEDFFRFWAASDACRREVADVPEDRLFAYIDGRLLRVSKPESTNQWASNKTGQGYIVSSTGDLYVGRLKDSKPHDDRRARKSFGTGDYYEGTFQDGHMHEGVYTYKNGDRLTASWSDGHVILEDCIYEFADGRKFQGQWPQNSLDGKGLQEYVLKGSDRRRVSSASSAQGTVDPRSRARQLHAYRVAPNDG